ncbi:MAG TPA: hypothetical protein VLI39_15210 [Sedimentisphaerales bacterium]|nr:hypothetical protein [Sedimentisphaerales bacterium]
MLGCGRLPSLPAGGKARAVVHTRETRSIGRQLDKQVHQEAGQWYWVTTLPTRQAPTGTVAQLGHARWDIENQGFNELVNQWHADHVYRHDPTALLVFRLLARICLTVFCAFFRRNPKHPPLRNRCGRQDRLEPGAFLWYSTALPAYGRADSRPAFGPGVY